MVLFQFYFIWIYLCVFWKRIFSRDVCLFRPCQSKTNSFISLLVFCLGFQPCDPLQVCIRVLWGEVHSSVWLLGGATTHKKGTTKGGFRLRFREMNIYTMTCPHHPSQHTHTHTRHQSIPISKFLKPNTLKRL